MKLSTLAVCLIATISCAGQNTQSTGLKFSSPAQLQGIPLASTPFSGESLPAAADLSLKMPPAGNQGKQNSCVGWAVAYGTKSYQEKLEENVPFMNGPNLNTQAVFSPAFIYNQINNGQDGGSLFPDALNVVSQQGAVKWADMPYTDRDYLKRPNQTQVQKAKRYKIDFWRRVNVSDVKEVKAQVNAGYPVVIGAQIDQGFQNGGNGGKDYTWKTQVGNSLGGHAMVVAGYSDARQAFKILNSWGQDWGTKGYCWISYSLFPKVVLEGYVMKDAVNTGDNTNPVNNDPVKPDIVNPTSDLKANFQLSNVQHNIQDAQLGTIMRFNGMAELPQGIGKEIQIVIKFFYNDGRNGKGRAVGGLSNYFKMPDGSAACGTPKAPIKAGNIPWYASMPYQYLNVPRGGYVYGQYQYKTSYLLAEPTLYIDGFAVKTGELIPFYVNL